MEFQMPEVPVGSGRHPIAIVVLSANDLAASGAFYTKLFGWKTRPITPDMTGIVAPAGPSGALRSNVPAGFPGMVPYIRVTDVDAMLSRVVAAGGAIEREPWSLPAVGRMARFKDPSGTIYGLTNATTAREFPRIPAPLGPNPKPPAGAICLLEMYAAEGAAAGFFGDVFAWGTLPTMPQYVSFDPGAGVGGTFQSHTPDLPAVAYIYANDVEAKIVEIEAAGGRRLGDPGRIPGAGCFGYFTDPSGTSMGLVGP